MGPRETVGVITGIATAGTLVVIMLLIMAMVCKYCYFRWTRRKGKNLRRSSRSNKRDQPLLQRMSRLDSNSSEVGEGNKRRSKGNDKVLSLLWKLCVCMYVCSNQNGKQFLWAWHFINKLATRRKQGEHKEVTCRRGNNRGG